jgi:hypothetical protein
MRWIRPLFLAAAVFALLPGPVRAQAYWAPLHTYVTTYGHSKQLDFTPYPDELPRFYLAKWK